MFHVKHRWGRFVSWFFGITTPSPAVALPDIVLPPDEECST